jgi:hypothetical protein
MNMNLNELIINKDYKGIDQALGKNPTLANEGIPYDGSNATKAIAPYQTPVPTKNLLTTSLACTQARSRYCGTVPKRHILLTRIKS